MLKLEIINGKLAEALIEGARILEVRDDGHDFHVFVELPKGGEWKFAYFNTIRFAEGKGPESEYTFLKGVEWNMVRKSAYKQFRLEVQDAKNHIRIVTEYHKKQQQ